MSTRGKAGTKRGGAAVTATQGLKVKEQQPSLQAAGRLNLLAKANLSSGDPEITFHVQVLDEDGDPVTGIGAGGFKVSLGAVADVVAVPGPLPGHYGLIARLLIEPKGQFVFAIKAQKGAAQGWTLVDVVKL